VVMNGKLRSGIFCATDFEVWTLRRFNNTLWIAELMAYFKILAQLLSGWAGENYENLRIDNNSPDVRVGYFLFSRTCLESFYSNDFGHFDGNLR
jgi:hypothetical protein